VVREGKAVRVLLVGYGYWGPNLLRNLAQCPHTRPVAVCDRDPHRLELVRRIYPSVATFTQLDAALDGGVDAAVVATPVATHAPIARRVLGAGKHVLIEKPLAASADEARALIALAQRTCRVLMVDHTFLYSAAIRCLRQVVESGELGEIYYVDSVRINLGLLQPDINVLWDLAPHDLSILDHVIGQPPRAVSAHGKAHVNSQIDVAHLCLDYSDRLQASMHVNWLSPVKIRHLLIGGSKKSVLYNDLDPMEKIRVYDRGVRLTEDPADRHRLLVDYRSGDVWSPHVGTEEPLQGVVRDFAESILDQREPLSNGELGLRIVELLEAADRSIRLGGMAVNLAAPAELHELRRAA
jgi:predicted dehydrogenase